jgi:hypothetical protein
LHLLGCFVVVGIDIPNLFYAQYESEFLDNYREILGFKQKLLYFAFQKQKFFSYINLVLMLILPILYTYEDSSEPTFKYQLAGRLFWSVVFGLTIGIYGALYFGLSAFYEHLIFWNVAGIALGLATSSTFMSSPIARVVMTILIVIFFGEVTERAFKGYFLQGATYGIAFVIGFFLFNYRLCFYPFYFFRIILGVSFYSSPYHNDAVISLPLLGAEKQFRHLALETPVDALKFVRFLREYRPLQTKLADSIAHAARAGLWLNQPLAFEVLQPPLIENDKLKPSDLWLKQLAELKAQLLSYRHQTQLSLRQQYFQRFLNQLDAFSAQTLVENKRWRDEYLQALALWKIVALEEQQQLTELSKQQEPITTNVYVSGEALNPELNTSVFLGRDDLKDELARRIASARQMPMFLFQGQRRVGKTSLLNFLEPLLGSGFKVVFQDLQDSRVSSVQTWLADLQERVSRKLDLPMMTASPLKDWQSCTDWLSAWHSFETWLNSLKLNDHYKLILAFDEYEELHHLLQANPEQGARLLAAMRSFSQQQNHIVFLFVGAALFTELDNPPWGQYFVQAQSFRVDYLPPADAKRLITEPVSLIYPPELPEQMVALTQGHPALLQWLCSEMVNIANRTPKKNMTQADLDQVLAELINNSSIAPMAVFWQQFCADAACKATVREIITAQPPTDKKQLHRLREHGFIVQDANGLWRLRVPLFERWLKAFDRVDLD